jgi:ABC-type transport system substrate-binding protein
VKSIVVHVLQDPSVALNALVAGYVQAAELSTSQLPAAKAAGFKIKATPTLVQHILFLDRKKTFADENVRKAVCLAVDMKTLTEAGYDGYATPVSQKFPPGQPGYNPNVHGYPHDLAAAKKYMAAAGNPKISFVLPMYPGNRNLMTLFAQQLRQIGIDAKPQLMTTGQYFTYYQSDKYPLQINSSATENLGPLDYYQFRFSPRGTGNPFHVDVPGLDAIAKRALAVTDEKAQNKIWQEATQYIHDHALDCGFFRQETTWAYNSKKIGNLPTTVLRPSALRYNEVKLAP